MTEIKDGGPAFPGPQFSEGGHPTGHGMGMTMRQYFAGQALLGMLAHRKRYRPTDGRADWHSAIAEEAYLIADAMNAASEVAE